MPKEWSDAARKWNGRGLRFRITPYVLSLVGRDAKGNPREEDAVWRQVFPYFRDSGDRGRGVKRPDEYSPSKENWEDDKEMLTPICQKKYDNRAIIYVSDACLGYCMYCFRSLQSCAGTERHGGLSGWKKTLEVLRNRPEIEEVILSGGDPLMLGNDMIDRILTDLRRIKSLRFIRIHTRAWTHNPFRIDKKFCSLLKRHRVTVLGVHAVHPNEVGDDFMAAAGRVRASGAHTMMMADIPLVKGINDSEKALRELFLKLYAAGVKPYYLSHNMPNIPCADAQRTSVKAGLELYNKLKRRISNTAMPEYIITHRSGKKTVPEDPKGTPDFRYAKNLKGWPVIRFSDWRGKRQTYLDSQA